MQEYSYSVIELHACMHALVFPWATLHKLSKFAHALSRFVFVVYTGTSYSCRDLLVDIGFGVKLQVL